MQNPVYKIRRTNRKKTVSLSVLNDNTVRILAPKTLPRSEIDAIIYKKRAWIAKKIDQNFRLPNRNQIYKFTEGEIFKFLGKEYKLKIVNDSSKLLLNSVTPTVNLLKVYTENQSSDQIQTLLERWYANEALIHIQKRVRYFEQDLKVKHFSIKVKKLKSRWGSCNTRGGLVFNWKIMQAPPSVIDLVVVHELCHLVHMNHSKKFWQLVGSIMPDYKIHRTWLKEYGHLLDFQ